MNLAYRYPTIFWDCACLISDSGGTKENEEEEEEEEIEDIINYDESVEDFGEEEEDDEEDDNESSPLKTKKKKKTKSNDYGKIASAIGKIQAGGVTVTRPNINKSTLTFFPNAESNIIEYGLSGISRINEDLIKEIIANRPYSSAEDFLGRIKLTKPQAVSIIKSGALDIFGDRLEIMDSYINSIYGRKNTVNLRNLQMLISYKMLPEQFDFQIKCFNYNKYLKKLETLIDGVEYYILDNIAIKFFEANFDIDQLVPDDRAESGFILKKTIWTKIYKKQQDIIRIYIKENHDKILENLNKILFDIMWNKYAEGSLSKWEMNSVSFYYHEHELANVNLKKNYLEDFGELPEQPEVESVIFIKGKQIPLFKISRICGTVLDRDKTKKIVTLLTTSGVVTVRFFGDIFTHYDRQISEKGPDGKKHVVEKSIFSRGNKIIVSGIRREDIFTAKKYSRTPWHMVELIESVNEDGTIITRERVGVD